MLKDVIAIIFILLLTNIIAKAEISKFEEQFLDLKFHLSQEKINTGCYPVEHKITNQVFVKGDFKEYLDTLLTIKELSNGDLSIKPILDLPKSVYISFRHYKSKYSIEYYSWKASNNYLRNITRKSALPSKTIAIKKNQSLGLVVSGNVELDKFGFFVKYDSNSGTWTATGFGYEMNTEGEKHTATLKVFNGEDYQDTPTQNEG